MSHRPEAQLDPADLETLAAFIDGRLEGAERNTVVARLAEDEAFYEVYAETLHFLEEEEGGKPVIDLEKARLRRTRQARWTGLAVAASLIAAFGSWQLFATKTPQTGDAYAGLFAEDAGDPSSVLKSELAGWRVVRGGPDIPPGLSETALDLRAGVHRMALEVGLGLATPAEMRKHADWLDSLTEERRFLVPGLGNAIELLLDQPSAGAVERFNERLSNVDIVFSRHPGYELGLFAQSCRIAAASHDLAFFQQRRVRRAFNRLGVADLVPDAGQEAQEISRILRAGANMDDLDRLGQACFAIAQKGGNL